MCGAMRSGRQNTIRSWSAYWSASRPNCNSASGTFGSLGSVGRSSGWTAGLVNMLPPSSSSWVSARRRVRSSSTSRWNCAIWRARHVSQSRCRSRRPAARTCPRPCRPQPSVASSFARLCSNRRRVALILSPGFARQHRVGVGIQLEREAAETRCAWRSGRSARSGPAAWRPAPADRADCSAEPCRDRYPASSRHVRP